jgi:hypothetical protein
MVEWDTCKRCIEAGKRICGVHEKRRNPAICADLKAEAEKKIHRARAEGTIDGRRQYYFKHHKVGDDKG